MTTITIYRCPEPQFNDRDGDEPRQEYQRLLREYLEHRSDVTVRVVSTRDPRKATSADDEYRMLAAVGLDRATVQTIEAEVRDRCLRYS